MADEKALNLPGFDFNRLVRYGYPGFLCAAVVFWINPEGAKDWAKAAGPIISPLAIIAIGACIYTFKRYIIGELLMYRCTLLPWVRKSDNPKKGHFRKIIEEAVKDPKVSRETIAQQKVRKWRIGEFRSIYTSLRQELFDLERRSRLDMSHSELHILGITPVLALTTSIICWGYSRLSSPGKICPTEFERYAIIFLLIAFVSGVGSWFAEQRQLKDECRLFSRDGNREKIRKIIFDSGLLSSGELSQVAEEPPSQG